MKFEPAVYEHAAVLIGETPWSVCRDARLLFEAHAAAFALYRHDPVTVGIDLYNVEPEAYGAKVVEPQGCDLPSIAAPLAGSVKSLYDLPPLQPERAGRLPMILDTAARLAEALPQARVAVPVSGPFSLASHLVGFEPLLCAALTEPDRVQGALQRLAEGQIAFSKAIAARGLHSVVFESGAAPPMLSPAVFAAVELAPLTALIQAIARISESPPACIMGGDTLPVLAALLSTGARHVIVPRETDQQGFLRVLEAYPEVGARVNIRSAPVAAGHLPDIYAEMDRVVRLAGHNPRASIGAGALPCETRPETVRAMIDYAHQAPLHPPCRRQCRTGLLQEDCS